MCDDRPDLNRMNYRFETGGALSPWDQREWLLTDGSGSFAMGTVAGVATRRYHGLLVAAMRPPLGRMHLVSRVGELLLLDGQSAVHELSNCLFVSHSDGGNRSAVVHPRGYRYLQAFELSACPGGGRQARWTYVVDGVTVDKTLHLPPMSCSAVLTYEVRFDAGRWVELLLLPMVSLRDFHALRRHAPDIDDLSREAGQGSEAGGDSSDGGRALAGSEGGSGRWGPMRVAVSASGVCVHAADVAGGLGVAIDATGANFELDADWWYGHLYPVESERGLDDVEDLFKPGVFRVRLNGPGRVELRMSPDPAPPKRVERHAAAVVKPGTSTTLQRLLQASDDFLVWRPLPDRSRGARTGGGGPNGLSRGGVATSVLAGFPWFGDWGRDSLIALPGLLLSTGRLEQAADVLRLYGGYVDQGMVPNRFVEETNSPEYNTVDASLWFIHACFAYREVAGPDRVFVEDLLPACREVFEGYRRGTRFGIRMDDRDGLIVQGDSNTQLTWMDARCDGVSFTPRHGKPVEVNALWYHALRCLGENELAERAGESFRRLFWISPQRGLADVVSASTSGAGESQVLAGDAFRDTRCRPNQIFAVSLPHSPLRPEQQRAVVEVVRRELLTPYGLRTLSPSERGYRPTYGGTPAQRDAAYHNGTVWPWLIGAFLDAYLKVHLDTREAREEARRMLRPLLSELETTCVGQLGEIYEAQPPHRAVGAPAQAWSVAEVLRLAVRLGV